MDLNEFFLVTLPGFEDLALKEALEWFPETSARVEHGGVTLLMPLEQGLSMNMALKIPTRILLRVTRFKCRDFPKLFQKVSSFPWKEWIDPMVRLDVHVATSQSRLSIKKRIKETCEEAWEKYRKTHGPKKTAVSSDHTVGLYVRIHEDLCTLSLDTSGERLHKRGQEKHIGLAPLRETIGAAMLQLLGQHSPPQAKVDVVDPMMGSGTLLMEAMLRDQVLSSRDFGFPAFKHSKLEPPVLKASRPQIHRLVGIEADKKTVRAAEHNFKSHKRSIRTPILNIFNQDVFQMKSLPDESGVTRWVVCNPPYGRRIKVSEPLKEFYERLLKAIDDFAKPDLICILIPKKGVKGKLNLPLGWKVLEKIKFSNGGIPITAYVFKAKHQYS